MPSLAPAPTSCQQTDRFSFWPLVGAVGSADGHGHSQSKHNSVVGLLTHVNPMQTKCPTPVYPAAYSGCTCQAGWPDLHECPPALLLPHSSATWAWRACNKAPPSRVNTWQSAPLIVRTACALRCAVLNNRVATSAVPCLPVGGMGVALQLLTPACPWPCWHTTRPLSSSICTPTLPWPPPPQTWRPR